MHQNLRNRPHQRLEAMTTTISDSSSSKSLQMNVQHGQRFASAGGPVLVIALKRNGAYAGDI